MGEQKYDEQRLVELQQQWHGWGSPVGFGIFLLCMGGVAALIGLTVSLVS